MYRVEVVTDGKKYPLLNKVLKLENPTLKELAGNSPGYLKFKISPLHPHYDKIAPLSSELFVFEDAAEIFRGRSITTEEAFNRTHQLTCESDLAYLCDSIMRPFDFQGSIYDFLAEVLNSHNAQVEPRKRFQIGNVNVVDSNNYIRRSNTSYSNSLDCLRSKLVNTHGGYLRTRLEGGVRYLDYVTDAGGTNEQVIRYGVNLVGYGKTQDATTVFTALIPTGADVEIANPDGTTDVKPIDITSVNNDQDYIYDPKAVEKYGWIFRQQRWEDVTVPANLLAKARAYLNESLIIGAVLELTAVDLANIDVDISRLKTGYWTRIVSKPHDIDTTYILEERTRNLQNPGKDTVSLGGTVPRLSSTTANQQAEMNAYVQQIASGTTAEIINRVNNATQLITGGLGGYVVIGQSENGQPEEIIIMDAPTKETAVNVIRLNRNGIGFSTAGYNGPFGNAWTIDGNLVADFITTGQMLADRIRGGTFEVGGSGLAQDGVIQIKNVGGDVVVNLDKNGISILSGSINLGNGNLVINNDGSITIKKGSIDIGNGSFKVTEGGVMTLAGTNNSSSVGCYTLSAHNANIDRMIINDGAEFAGALTAMDIDCDEISCTQIYSSMAGAWWSDRRVKKNVVTIPSKVCMDVVRNLRPVSFEYRDSGMPSVGFIAQEVQQVIERCKIKLPLVSEHEGLLCIPYATYVSLLAGAVQEQQKQIDQFKRRSGNGRHKQRNK